MPKFNLSELVGEEVLRSPVHAHAQSGSGGAREREREREKGKMTDLNETRHE